MSISGETQPLPHPALNVRFQRSDIRALRRDGATCARPSPSGCPLIAQQFAFLLPDGEARFHVGDRTIDLAEPMRRARWQYDEITRLNVP
jgi:hypothetical protein